MCVSLCLCLDICHARSPWHCLARSRSKIKATGQRLQSEEWKCCSWSYLEWYWMTDFLAVHCFIWLFYICHNLFIVSDCMCIGAEKPSWNPVPVHNFRHLNTVLVNTWYTSSPVRYQLNIYKLPDREQVSKVIWQNATSPITAVPCQSLLTALNAVIRGTHLAGEQCIVPAADECKKKPWRYIRSG